MMKRFTVISTTLSIMLLLSCSPENQSVTGTTFADSNTHLEWTRCASGLSGDSCGDGTQSTLTWEEAITECENLTLDGRTDWRLPTVRELASTIVYYYLSSPQLDREVFPNSSTDNYQFYWTSTSVADADNYAWIVKPWLGEIQYRTKDTTGFVRCVRGP